MAKMRRSSNKYVLIQSICSQLTTVSAGYAPAYCAELYWYEGTDHLSPLNQKLSNMDLGASRNDDNTLAPSQLQRGNRNADRSDITSQPAEGIAEAPGSRDSEPNAPVINPFMSWDEMGLGQEDLGFLGRFDLPDLATWFSDVPDVLS